MRYQKIWSQLWHDDKFNALSDDARMLFVYILTSPHSNAIGMYILPKQYIAADLNWSVERLHKPFVELLKKRLIGYDESVKLCLIFNHFKHNSCDNPNQVKAAIKLVDGLPKSLLFKHFKASKLLDKPFLKPLLERLNKQLPTETETEAETKDNNSNMRTDELTETENAFIATFNEKADKLKELYPHADFKAEKETCIAHYRNQPHAGLDPYTVILKWFNRIPKGDNRHGSGNHRGAKETGRATGGIKAGETTHTAPGSYAQDFPDRSDQW